MQFWVYMLRCNDGSYYVGHTDRLESRIAQHQVGRGCDWTRRRLPVALVWADHTSSREEALAFERRIKGWTRLKKEALIAGDWKEIGRLAKPLRERLSGATVGDVEEIRIVRPERSAQREVEGRGQPIDRRRPSTSLRTNETGVTIHDS